MLIRIILCLHVKTPPNPHGLYLFSPHFSIGPLIFTFLESASRKLKHIFLEYKQGWKIEFSGPKQAHMRLYT
uniref:Putative ovule protein n=1 Tax=Solanum chacoense TaxID=4108 RepID=A0A0V0H721_SOLCH